MRCSEAPSCPRGLDLVIFATPSIVVLIPAFNAATPLRALLAELRCHVDPGRTIVVDDGSADETAAVAATAGVEVIRHVENAGKGGALRTGFDWILAHRTFDAVVTMDADGQHDPADMKSLIDVWTRTEAGLVVGWRKRAGTRMPMSRRLSNKMTSFLVRARTGQDIRDSQCGYRLITRRTLEEVRFLANGFEAETEFILRAGAKGIQITSAPIHTIYSRERSFMTHWKTTKAFVRVLLGEYT
ncbi:MAG TPA: glycosyltransferase family 2 protein [Bacteroidetes bacterium]|nr:glycosyltransferase family 2 protein [Bacteroidota bacterium]